MDVEAYLASQCRAGRFSGAALIQHHGEPLVDAGYGPADRANHRPNGPQTIFQICSTSKQFTATAILLLQDRNALSVDDCICRWLPHCPTSWEQITLHHLLTHTSGIGHWFDYPTLDFYEPMDREDLISLLQNRDLSFTPGTAWAYSSPGYVLLSEIVERISGVPYATFLDQSIFGPLGMVSTGAGAQAPRAEDQAVGYNWDEPARSMELVTVGVGAGDVWSSTGDMLRFYSARRHGALLATSSLQAMYTPHARVTEAWLGTDDLSYGYGNFIGWLRGHLIIFHPGHNAGFRSMSILLPDDDAAVILLSNQENTDTDSVSRPIVEEITWDRRQSSSTERGTAR